MSESDIPLSPIEDIIEDARNGRMFILVDAEDRENEGDLVIPAKFATPDAINFMAKHGRGLICLAMDQERIAHLGLKLMASDNRSRHQTAFTTSIEAREGVTTGISAHDRARTIEVATDPSKGESDDVIFTINEEFTGPDKVAAHIETAKGNDYFEEFGKVLHDYGKVVQPLGQVWFAIR